ncbi:MAG: lysylphosphatidylglycerol synthase domain-containing protein, partial [Pseudomonadota bacterium]|nr:lysylphosphatidylglycerol synthase domain-containing protein [Pseudomonadota bacterium]
MSKKALLPLLSVLAILAYGIVIEQVWSWSVLFDRWQSVGWSILGVSVVLMLLTHLIRGFRFYHFFLHDMPDRGLGTFLRLFSVSQTHNFLNSLLPFRSGEVSFPVLTKTEFALPMSRTAAGLLWMRMLDLHALGVFALVVVLYRFLGSSIMLWLLILFALLIPWLVFELGQPIRRFLERAQQEAYSGLAGKLIHFAWK